MFVRDVQYQNLYKCKRQELGIYLKNSVQPPNLIKLLDSEPNQITRAIAPCEKSVDASAENVD